MIALLAMLAWLLAAMSATMLFAALPAAVSAICSVLYRSFNRKEV